MNASTLRHLNVIGLNSGTSMDGIDAALFSIRPRSQGNGNGDLPELEIELLGSVLEEFPPQFRRKMQKVVAAGDATLQNVCLLNTALGELFAQAALHLMRTVPNADVNLIGSHGQTIWHAPDSTSFAGVNTAGTLQLGEPAIIAARTGIPVIADFRPADIANGGEGAPLVAFADAVLFGKDAIATAVLNIGGIANLTVIDKSGKPIMAFDTGPGNVLMDRTCQRLFGTDLDLDGKFAATGTVSDQLMESVLSNSYFTRVPPKTTGRELFGESFADAFLDQAELSKLSRGDILRTVTAITARSIADAYKQFVLPVCRVERLILGGGGAANKTLIELLAGYWPDPVKILNHEDCGISTKFKESLLFALLAYTTYFGVPNNVPDCTGASRKTCLGKMCQP